jgi:hypothetical protein
MRPLVSRFFDDREKRRTSEAKHNAGKPAQPAKRSRVNDQFLSVTIEFESTEKMNEFEKLGIDFLPQFKQAFPGFSLWLSGKDPTKNVIYNHWLIPSADAVLLMIRELADMPDYAKLDALVKAEVQELYTPIDDDDTHGRVKKDLDYNYVVAYYKAGISDLAGLGIDVSALYGRWESQHPGWFLEDTVIAITGKVYSTMQIWGVNGAVDVNTARSQLKTAPWCNNNVSLSDVAVLPPTSYDRRN